MGFKNYKDESRTNWGTFEEKLTLEQINTGALLRIADAVEKSVLDIDKLKLEKQSLLQSIEYYKEQRQRDKREISNLKGNVTRLTNKLKALENNA